MKRIAFAIAISTAFLIFYLGTSAVIYFAAGQDDSLIAPLGTLVQLPSFLLAYFYPKVVSGETPIPVTWMVVIILSAIIVNILLYSIPAYFILWIISRVRKPKAEQALPPQPPSFMN